MNNFQKALELATTQGYDPGKFGYGYCRAKVLLDPEFFHSLGKALGWNKTCATCGNPQKPHQYRHVYSESKEEAWPREQHRFIEHLIAGKDPDLFLPKFLLLLLLKTKCKKI